jgi:uncharacterized protein (DUF2062 family)
MIFGRRIKPNLPIRISQMVWPKSGWRRATLYIAHRVARIPDTSYRIAAGFACGAAVSFTPLIGSHFVLSALMAWVIRANVVSALIGTVVGNPWTFPLIIWPATYQIGIWIGAGQDAGESQQLDFVGMFSGMTEALLRLDIPYLLDQVWPIWWPMMMGSIPALVVTWLVFYFPLNAMVTGYKHRRRHRRSLRDRSGAAPRAVDVREGRGQ